MEWTRACQLMERVYMFVKAICMHSYQSSLPGPFLRLCEKSMSEVISRLNTMQGY